MEVGDEVELVSFKNIFGGDVGYEDFVEVHGKHAKIVSEFFGEDVTRAGKRAFRLSFVTAHYFLEENLRLSPPAPAKPKGEKERAQIGQIWTKKEGYEVFCTNSTTDNLFYKLPESVRRGLVYATLDSWNDDEYRETFTGEWSWAPGYGPSAPDQNGNSFTEKSEPPKPEPQWSGRDSDGLTFTDRKMLMERVEREEAERKVAVCRERDAAELKSCETSHFDGEFYMTNMECLVYSRLVGRRVTDKMRH